MGTKSVASHGSLALSMILVCFFFCSQPSIAQQQAIFCLSDGSKIAANRFETVDGKFRLFVTGSVAPLEYPASEIKGINVDPCPAFVERTPIIKASPDPSPANQVVAGRRFGVYGSNTIGERLMPMLIHDFARRKFGRPPTSKITGNEEQEISLVSTKADETVKIDLRAHGSGTAAKGLVEGAAAIGMASRRLTQDEVKIIQDKFHIDAHAPDNEHVLALDGVAVIINPTNPVERLSLEQIAGVFSGRITNWKDVGGLDHPVRVLRRDDKSGTYDVFKSLVLAPAKKDISPDALPFESSEILSEQVSQDPYSIGFVGLPYVNRNKSVAISSSCGITHRLSKFSVKIEEYPLTRRLYLYTPGKLSEPFAADLLQFVLSDEAQKTITDSDFIEQTIMFEDEKEQGEWLAANSPEKVKKSFPLATVDEFQRLASTTRRSSLAFRFTEGGSTLDNRATQDVDRLVQFVQKNMISGERVFVVGFADANGDFKRNLALAYRRSTQVAVALERKGVPLGAGSVKSFASLAPVACDDSESGSAKNRRVEVWIKM